jgi:predicted DNA-binding protein
MSRKIGTKIQVRLDVQCESRLKTLAEVDGCSISAIIRYCIKKQLPELEAKLNPQSPTPSGQGSTQ